MLGYKDGQGGDLCEQPDNLPYVSSSITVLNL